MRVGITLYRGTSGQEKIVPLFEPTSVSDFIGMRDNDPSLFLLAVRSICKGLNSLEKCVTDRVVSEGYSREWAIDYFLDPVEGAMAEEIKRALAMSKEGGPPKGLYGLHTNYISRWINVNELQDAISDELSRFRTELSFQRLINSAADPAFREILEEKISSCERIATLDDVISVYIESFREAVESKGSLEEVVREVSFPENYVKIVVGMLKNLDTARINTQSCALNTLIQFSPRVSFLREVKENCLGPASLMELLLLSAKSMSNRRKMTVLVLMSMIGYAMAGGASHPYLLINEDLTELSVDYLENHLRKGLKKFLNCAKSRFPGTLTMDDVEDFFNSLDHVKTPYKLPFGLIVWNWVYLANSLEDSLRKAINARNLRDDYEAITDINRGLMKIHKLIKKPWVLDLLDIYFKEVIGCCRRKTLELDQLPKDLMELAMSLRKMTGVREILDFILNLHRRLCMYCMNKCYFTAKEDLILASLGSTGPFVQGGPLMSWAEYITKCGEINGTS